MILGAVRRSPDIAQWQSALEPWRAVVVYCDRGHQASRNAATTMRERGYDALYAWCREAAREAHGWNPAALRQAMASSAREA
jgi:rhodanese-related sulfurtransferase